MPDDQVSRLFQRPDLPATAEGFSPRPSTVAIDVAALRSFAVLHGVPEAGLDPRLDAFVESIGGQRLELIDFEGILGRTLRRIARRSSASEATEMYLVPVGRVAARFATRPPAPMPAT